MSDLFGSRQLVRLNDGTADANNANITNTTPGGSDYALVVRPIMPASTVVDTELAAAAALADATANPTVPLVGSAGEVYNGTTWDRMRSVVNGQDSAGTGIPASGILGQLDDTATGAVTENQFAPVRISTRRALLVEGVASGTNLNVNLAASAATVTVDSELPAAAALADATANPTVPGVGGFLMGFNGTTWDRVRTANTGRLQVDVITGGGSSTLVDNAGFTDGTTPVTPVGFIFDEVAGTALTENDVAAARVDAKRALIGVIEDATTRGQRAAVTAGGGLGINLLQVAGGTAINDGVAGAAAVGGSLAHDAAAAALFPLLMGAYANAAAPADVSADVDAVRIWALRNGSQVVNLAAAGTLVTFGQKTMANAFSVSIASDQSAIAVDTELPAAAALADATANPTVPGVGAFGLGYNGTTWDRIRTANTGRLQVDVVTGGSSAPASEVPTLYNALIVVGSTSATGAGSTASVVTNTPANTKTVYVRSALIAASGATKWQVKFGATVLATGFTTQSQLTAFVRLDPPSTITGDGSTALTIDVTNREGAAQDLYARIGAIVLA